ncbi:MAG TPA: transglutaminase-like domain-containing protein, partial [Candidatus Binatia bacterium]|nr:transglutaminase-like domain-containing protein [Candidatus Binatia bacterium]
DNTSWSLIPGKRSASAVNITCYLNGWSRDLGAPEGLLPLPGGCNRLENVPANVSLKKNPNGAVLAAGRGLLIFDADYGPGATIDSPPDVEATNHYDLSVPANEAPALQSVISEMHLSAKADHEQKLQSVERFFFSKFTYSTWQGTDKLATRDTTPLTRFLLTSRSGHCEYFATATVLLLRELGIPARYAVGYYVHETHGSGYVVRERDAHAWCLIWDAAAKCWKNFDTTPPSWVGIEEKRTAGSEWFADLRSWLGLQFAKFRWDRRTFNNTSSGRSFPCCWCCCITSSSAGSGNCAPRRSGRKSAPPLSGPAWIRNSTSSKRSSPRAACPGKPASRFPSGLTAP